MGLKAFHIFFVVVSVALCIGLGVWATLDYAQSGDSLRLALGVGSFLGGIALAYYGVWFLRKLKGVGYL
ncbi:MAG: hypothetical protein VX681_05130 [Myxococcota bacterium]|nr:hypothetical protein [Myxococcota bacterium]